MGSDIIKKMDDINTHRSSDTGVWYEHTYMGKHPENWDEKYIGGHAPEEFSKIAPMNWQLQPGKSASKAIQKWLDGLTIAECGSTLVAIHLDALRKQLVDAKFDECFGSANGSKPTCQLLRVTANHEDCFPAKLLKAAGTKMNLANRSLCLVLNTISKTTTTISIVIQQELARVKTPFILVKILKRRQCGLDLV